MQSDENAGERWSAEFNRRYALARQMIAEQGWREEDGPIGFSAVTSLVALAFARQSPPADTMNAVVATGWRPISEAPKDGTAILVWADGYEWPETIRWYEYDPECAEDTGEPGYWHYAEELLHDTLEWEHEVSHFMPLPEPPIAAAETDVAP